jgi:Glycoside hydrolase family 44
MRILSLLAASLIPSLALAQPIETVVWSGAKPAGQTWAHLGARGKLAVQEGAGLDGGKGLVLHMDGEGYRGAGVNWKGWYPPDAGTDTEPYTSLVFRIKQISKVADADLTVHLIDNIKRAGEVKPVSQGLSIRGDGGVDKIDGEWRTVTLPLARFSDGTPLRRDRIWEVDFSNNGSTVLTFHIDKIAFTGDKAALTRFKAGEPYTAEAKVIAAKNLGPIHDAIFGVCGLPREKLETYGIPITRWGGNPSTVYNWKLNVDSAGADWFYKNRGRTISKLTDTGYLKTIQANQAIGATTYVTIPMIGWVAKDDHSYGYSVKKYGPQKGAEPGHPDIGNGIGKDGKPLTNEPTDNAMPVGPEFIEEAVRFVAEHAGKANAKGIAYWALDNEPMIWHATHRDVRHEPLGYDELWERTVQYAEAIKKADPTAKVAGFCSWGWTDLFYSSVDQGKDNYRALPDWNKHGKMPLGEWFIKKCGDYKKEHGKALIDVFDFHWYPQGQARGQGVYMGKGRFDELCGLRMRSTRDLWDPKYQQESWIKSSGDQPTALLPRIRRWIESHNPGMELAVGEYNFGGSDNITGALAQAEVFGIMAREKVDLAFIWFNPEGTQELGWKLFRDYDGKRSRFGSQLVDVQQNPASPLSVFAARRADGATTVMLVNKDLHSPCKLSLELPGVAGAVEMWRLDQDSDGKIALVKDAPSRIEGRVELTVPAASASMLVVRGR